MFESIPNIPKPKIESFKENFKKGAIWEIHPMGSQLIVFFYTKKQVEENCSNSLFQKMKLDYFQLVKQFNKENFFPLEKIEIVFDSKENFDKGYEGNWVSYYR